MWIDNFSKFVSRSIPTVERGVFSQCLWTGVSLFDCPDATIDVAVKYDDDHNMIPAMPPHILLNQEVVQHTLHTVLQMGPRYYDQSLVKRYDVRNVPLKVDSKRFPHLADTLNSYNQRRVISDDLLDINIGSNRGLISIVRQVADDLGIIGESGCDNYVILNVDENIFWRILKVY